MSNRAKSMPVEAEKCAKPPSTLAWRRYSSSLSCASLSVRPTITVAPTKALIGRAPARARRSATRLATLALPVPLMNTHSACRPANARPRLEAPAWYSTGVRCGEGSQRWMASML